MNARGLKAGAMVVVVLGYVAFEVTQLRNSQHLFEPLHTFDQFVSANRAAERCGGAHDPERRSFLRNLEAVERWALDDLSATHPKESAEAIAQRLADRARGRERDVDVQIEEGGCEAPEVWGLRKLHEQRARLRLR